MKKKALIFGITGQDGSYLAEFLIKKKYVVHGVKRKSSSLNTSRIDHLYNNGKSNSFYLHYGDLADSLSIQKIINDVKPNEIYNLAAQSHVAVSFELPEYTSDINAIGTLRILECIKFLGLEKKVKFYQAGTSEMFGKVQETPQSEKTSFYPRSPYGVAKVYAHWITVNYREAYNIFACNGILFNHESPRRGETFVTRKITRGLASIALGLEDCLYMGNIGSLRDWGHAKDFVKMQWMMLQQEKPKDYVIATGKQHSVREFIIWAANALGIELEFVGKGIDEVGIVAGVSGELPVKVSVGQKIIKVHPRYFRPTEVDSLLGDASKAKKDLGWKSDITVQQMCREMVEEDYKAASRAVLLKQHKLDLPYSIQD